MITGNTDPFADWTLKWFPTLTDHISLTTIQGYEWLSESNFREHIYKIQLLQLCLSDNVPLTCVEAQAKKLSSGYDFIYITRDTAIEMELTGTLGGLLIFELTQDKDHYKKVYQSEEVSIFSHQP